MNKKSYSQRGDTLIEVAIALTIMSAVLISAFLLATKSAQIGRIAKERTMMVSAAQEQAELLTAYRDRLSWPTFVNSIKGSSGCTLVDGTKCFSFDVNSVAPSLATSGMKSVDGVATSKLYITSNINTTPTPNPVEFIIHYSAESPGGDPEMKSQIDLRLGDISDLRTLATP